ncbi:HAD superfamily hydrolase (TIGR01509 family) [Leucobacter exalbidus]|uniref:HAD superfamily hydrolase (TIGR01509 family) n=1 Tax=Leucobacter exalbidus TaxID=662960 RepID=A0A940T3J4_9MICO|nr:HAD family phosphatase [Leucobacter exalbidus]MBP1325878.1 HAD superfamily hydrolase (TIGR01509 family) [Leucobacter exalbidus]
MNDTSTPSPHPLAVLCDLDGTLVDTERAWLDAISRGMHQLGHTVDDHTVASLEGATLEQASDLLINAYGLTHSPAALGELFESMTLGAFADSVQWRPGAEALLTDFARAGIPLALVTSSTKRWVDVITAQLDFSMFAHFVTADDVAHTKPHPTPYLVGAGLLGIAPERCIVFEDSRVGLEAALAAGCTSVLVREGREDWAQRATVHVPSLTDLNAQWVTNQLA